MGRETRLDEATIAETQAGIRSGETTCHNIVERYLSRIAAYDRSGPTINAIINTNTHALAQADALDRFFADTGKFVGPMHGVTLLVKDQIQTRDIPTTFGSIAFKDYVPKNDATLITRLRNAGAIVLAKTLLSDFALSWFAFSSVGGETRNPYALERDTGGSSSGTAAAVAANLGAAGIGEDSGGSIRVPAAFNNLVGLRVTTGLISRNGMQPLVVQDDTAGPMTRTVLDTAKLLDVLVAYDSSDPYTAVVINASDRLSYSSSAVEDGLAGARIGILRSAFGPNTDPDAQRVNMVVEEAISTMASLGSEVVEPGVVDELAELIEFTTVVLLQTRRDIDSYLARLPDAPVRSIRQIHESGRYHQHIDLIPQIAASPADPEEDGSYFKRLATREQLRRALLDVMASNDLDAVLYPTVAVLPPLKDDLRQGKWAAMAFPANTRLAAHIGFPAISVPAGFTEDGIPVGLELMARPYDERTLIKLAYSFERAARHRRAPESAPPLPG
jgi:Asp-tRNA(Asn)/Glu-tRNA(Gln) amidotransferase A subunit family amidase